MKILLHLEFRQLANYAKLTLRSPKRLIPVLLMAVSLLIVLGPQLFMASVRRSVPFPTAAIRIPDHVWSAAFAALSLAMIYMAQKGFSESTVVFRMPDIDFLFPTPVRRQAIMTLKLLSVYANLGASVLFIVVLLTAQFWMIARLQTGPVFASALAVILYAIFLINICTVINLVATFRPGGKWWLAWFVRGATYSLIAFAAWRMLSGYSETGDVAQSVVYAFRHPVFLVLMLPAKWTADLGLGALTGWRVGFGNELAALGVLAAASFALVLQRKENPYEPSLAVSARKAAIRAAFRSGGWGRARQMLWKQKQGAPGIRPFGRGAVALIWKNLNVTLRTSRKVLVAIPVVMVAALVAVRLFAPQVTGGEVEGFAAAGLAYVLFIFSTMMLHSFRADIKQANILRPMPISAWQLVGAEMVHSALLIALFTWITVALVAAFYGLQPRSFLLTLALAVPFVAYGSLCWQAVAAIIYPNWEDPTQQYIGLMLSGLGVMLGLGPPALIGVLGWYLKIGVVPTALAMAFVSAGISVVAVALSGYLYKQHDPTDE